MPRWDFVCPACERVQEDYLLLSESLWPKCPDHGIDMVKRPSAPALSFKGPGWTPKFHKGQS
jgi:predicted nucleic acid-binding Zn ribbon protein